ncbi:MAG TPA: AtzE family amidohydrolase [Alphaproteobacteria bacterium]|nr:AtzE family amidohydrolase [Alphaproteobacteria bacterium]
MNASDLSMYFDRINALNPRLNAFIDLVPGRAAAPASGPLAGKTFAFKDLYDFVGLTTRAGSAILADNPPATEDAAAVASLIHAGAVPLGATNMDEFAFGFTTENSHVGPAHNPHDLTRTAGGSSGGSAAAVAAGLADLALGTDTNGSVRVPASFCGVFGLKPTFGRLSRRGVFPFSTSLDHVGLFARTVEDLAVGYDALQGRDPRDPMQADRPPEPVGMPEARPLRVAVLGYHFSRYAGEAAAEALAKAARVLQANDTVDVALASAARAAGALITYAEAGELHRERLKTDRHRLDPMIRYRLTAAALMPAQWYLQAQRVRRLLKQQIDALFETYDLLLAPATPFPAFAIGTETVELGDEIIPARSAAGIMTQPLTPAGVPVAVAPLWPAEGHGLPVGVQLIARPWAEADALAAAFMLEQAGAANAPVANL